MENIYLDKSHKSDAEREAGRCNYIEPHVCLTTTLIIHLKTQMDQIIHTTHTNVHVECKS